MITEQVIDKLLEQDVSQLDLGPTPYEVWMKRVDAELMNLVGLESGGMPDFSYRDWFDRDESPKRTAKAAIMNAVDLMGLDPEEFMSVGMEEQDEPSPDQLDLGPAPEEKYKPLMDAIEKVLAVLEGDDFRYKRANVEMGLDELGLLQEPPGIAYYGADGTVDRAVEYYYRLLNKIREEAGLTQVR